MNKFILISIALLCILAVLNLNKPKQVPEHYQRYDSLLREYYKAYEKGDRETAIAKLKESCIVIPLEDDGNELDSVLLANFNDGSAMMDPNLRKIIASAFGSNFESVPLSEDVEIVLKAYTDSRFFMQRAESYKEKIEAIDNHLKVKIVSSGACDLEEEFLDFDLYNDLEMYLPDSSLMIEMGISHGE